MRKSKSTCKIVNCDRCGRDTKNRCRICVHCLGGNSHSSTSSNVNLEDSYACLYADVYTRDDDIAAIIHDAIDDMIN